ncbi:MAG: alpha/beta hydrolase, partial [Burkholderiaceae bacterium]
PRSDLVRQGASQASRTDRRRRSCLLVETEFADERPADRDIALIEALMQPKGGGTVILVGHSMGGMVAQEVVARRPELVSHLVLCGTSPSFGKPDGDWQRSFIAERTAPLDAGQDMGQLAQVLVPQMVGPGALPEGVQLAQHVMAGVNPSTYRRALEALVTFDRKSSLAAIHVPTLLVAGEYDRNAPTAVMRRMGEHITGSDFIELPNVGHLMNLEAPDEFDAAVLSFLAIPRMLH